MAAPDPRPDRRHRRIPVLKECAYSRWLGPSSVTGGTLARLRAAGRITADGESHGAVLPRCGSTFGSPPRGHIVVFAVQLDVGLCFPTSEFVEELLKYFELEVSDLHPSVFSRMAIFEYAVQTMCMSSTASTFAVFHEPFAQTTLTPNKKPSLFGSICFKTRARPSNPYPLQALKNKWRNWHEEWFFYRVGKLGFTGCKTVPSLSMRQVIVTDGDRVRIDALAQMAQQLTCWDLVED